MNRFIIFESILSSRVPTQRNAPSPIRVKKNGLVGSWKRGRLTNRYFMKPGREPIQDGREGEGTVLPNGSLGVGDNKFSLSCRVERAAGEI